MTRYGCALLVAMVVASWAVAGAVAALVVVALRDIAQGRTWGHP